jgi:hypothetical protein
MRIYVELGIYHIEIIGQYIYIDSRFVSRDMAE